MNNLATEISPAQNGHIHRRLLFLLPYPPRLDATHGGGRVMAQIVVNLARRHSVALIYLRGPDDPPLDSQLEQVCAQAVEVRRPETAPSDRRQLVEKGKIVSFLVRGKPLWAQDWSVPEFSRQLQAMARTWQPDIVHVEYAIMGQYLDDLAGCPAPRVLTEYEPGVTRARHLWKTGQAAGWLMPFFDFHAWERYERSVLSKVQAVVAFTERDRDVLTRYSGGTPVVRISPGIQLPDQCLNPLGEPPDSLLFVGNFSHSPNVDAAARLAGSIFPVVQANCPESILYIVGDHVPDVIRSRGNATIVITGRVPDMVPYLDRAAVVVVPLRLGGGMRVKVLEALAAGKAVVASPLAVEGLDLSTGEQVLLAESDAEFSAACMDLLANPKRRAELAGRARDWACENLGWQKPVEAYERVYRQLVAGPE